MPIIQDFVTIFLGITVEALPFVAIGVSVSVLVHLFVRPEWVSRYMPQNRFLSHLFVSVLGIFMPVCECGNVPVARRLMMQGFSTSQAITFLLAAPIINPITFYSTWEAFGFDHSVALIRMGAALVISVGIGLLFSLLKNQQQLLKPKFREQIIACLNEDADHDHNHGRLSHALELFRDEFITTLRLLLFGALIAAATQTLIPRNLIESVGQSPTLSIVAMLILAFVVSICANIDAFFALAYVNTFTMGSLSTFLVFGPMIDIKILAMLRQTFTVKTLVIITALVATSSVLTGLIVNLLR